MSTPLVSIIIPAYNHAREIEEDLKTLLAQTIQDFEVIVVNDGSTDNINEVLKKYKDKIKIINQENQGGNAARNRGFEESRGKFLLFLDADIKMKPEMLEKMLEALKNNPEKSYVYSSFKLGSKKFNLWHFDAHKLKELNYIHTTSLMRREHFPGFDPKIKKFQDWDLWLTMLAKGYTGVWIPKILFQIKPRKSGLSTWLPKFFYKIPWTKLGFKIKAIREYEEALGIIKEKHGLK